MNTIIIKYKMIFSISFEINLIEPRNPNKSALFGRIDLLVVFLENV
jgi:hypothetical protein